MKPLFSLMAHSLFLVLPLVPFNLFAQTLDLAAIRSECAKLLSSSTVSDVSFAEVKRTFYSHHNPYADSSLLSSGMEKIWANIPPRDVIQDRVAAYLVEREVPKYKDSGGLIIVDSGHAHSVAIAVKLAQAGWRPVFKMGKTKFPEILEAQIQGVAAMKFYSRELALALSTLKPNAPTALIMDAHRNDLSAEFLDLGGQKADSGDHEGYRLWRAENIRLQTLEVYGPETLPSVSDVKAKFQSKIIWITEGELCGLEPLSNPGPQLLSHYIQAGISVLNHRADPYLCGTIQGESVKLIP